jgi:hypothetical protein
MTLLRSIIASLLMVALSSCGTRGVHSESPAVYDSSARSRWSPALARAIADNQVTEQEYHEGFRRYAACLAADGFQLANVVDRGVRIDFAVPAAAVDSGSDAKCYASEFDPVDTLWQVTHDDPQVTDQYRKCLMGKGLTPPASQQDMITL